MKEQEIKDAIEESFNFALSNASEEAFGGAYDRKVLFEMIDTDTIKKEALMMILNYEN